jgi:DNA-binding NtrC family response regulator
LIVDDEDEVRQRLARVFSGELYAEEAKDGAEALAKLERARFDLVLLDQRMPGLSGLEVLRTIKKKHPEIDVIMVTASDDRSLRKVNTRIVAATNRDLEKEVKKGQFREDLYFRLLRLPIRVPALRERPEDVPRLAHYFLNRFGEELNKRLAGFSDEAIKAHAFIVNALESAGANISKAARKAGMDRKNFRTKMAAHGISTADLD